MEKDFYKKEKDMKNRTTKRAMLFSVLALVLCMSMFVGTTYAWFTDSVTSANNVITAGNLDVTMEWLEGENLCYCDTIGALGGDHLLSNDKVRCMKVSTGRTSQAFVRLSEKVLANIENFLA